MSGSEEPPSRHDFLLKMIDIVPCSSIAACTPLSALKTSPLQAYSPGHFTRDTVIKEFQKDTTDASATVKIVAPKVGGAKLADSSMLTAGGQLAVTPFVLFEAVAVILSDEGGWTVMAAIDESVPVPVLSAALYECVGSRGEADFADKVLSILNYEFGGHDEKAAMTGDV